jgi:hypothetical protein
MIACAFTVYVWMIKFLICLTHDWVLTYPVLDQSGNDHIVHLIIANDTCLLGTECMEMSKGWVINHYLIEVKIRHGSLVDLLSVRSRTTRHIPLISLGTMSGSGKKKGWGRRDKLQFVLFILCTSSFVRSSWRFSAAINWKQRVLRLFVQFDLKVGPEQSLQFVVEIFHDACSSKWHQARVEVSRQPEMKNASW